jgi:hypothetical protein
MTAYMNPALKQNMIMDEADSESGKPPLSALSLFYFRKIKHFFPQITVIFFQLT